MSKTTDHRITIRLKPDEYALLTVKAGTKPISTFLRDLALKEAAERRKPNTPAPLKDRKDLAQALALLGKSGLSQSMAELARGVRLGTLPISEETEAQIETGCRDIATMKSALMCALGIQER
ncbi:hypothetical protein [Roseibium sp.]|uniref:hypothetical protein n=1 Tax=Roseibium sp. TaxID=1936156 RepID=UPI003A97FEF3